ncbi:outer membrane beta-barrel protein [Roseibacillus persicicus]|uniref:outer membrane beta-barrel protein n=1 Tax=Roseibacillus persicicus TaxID=454148 RepID=UPI002810DB85|nr:outer membrane beta-barrel protein [Roseibacillus persicicus]
MQQSSDDGKPPVISSIRFSDSGKGMMLLLGLASSFFVPYSIGEETVESAEVSREERQAAFQEEVAELVGGEPEEVSEEVPVEEVSLGNLKEEQVESVKELVEEGSEADEAAEVNEEEAVAEPESNDDETDAEAETEASAEEGEQVGDDEALVLEEEGEEVPLPEQSDQPSEKDAATLLPELEGTGIITGEVFGPSGEGLPGVVISIPSIDRSTRADQEGFFGFADLPAAELVVQFNKLGYKVSSRTLVLKEGESVEISQALEEQPIEFDDGEYEMDEVEVVGEYVEEEKFELKIDTLSTDTKLTAGITEAEFTKSAVSDAGDAVAKVSGANIVDGKFAVVRGLADRYVTTTFNGGAVASAVPDRKAIQLDLFPTSVIRGIDVGKTYDTRQIGDFGGAAIDIKTKLFPEERILKFKTKATYLSELPDEVQVMGDQDLGFFGSIENTINPDQLLTIDESSGGLRLPQGVLTFPVNGTAAEQAAAQNRIDEALFSWNALHKTRDLNSVGDDAQHPLSHSLTFGDTFELSPGIRMGLVLAGAQSSGDSYNETVRTDSFASSSWYEQQYSRNREWSAYGSVGLELGEYHTLQATYFRKHVAEQNVTLGSDLVDPDGKGFGNTDNYGQIQNLLGAAGDLLGGFVENTPVERDMEIVQLGGSHQLGERAPKLSWSYTDASASESRPDTSLMNYSSIVFDSPELIQFAEDRTNRVIDLFTNGLNLSERPSSIDELRAVVDSMGLSQAVVDNQLRQAGVPTLDTSREQIDTLVLLPYRGGSSAGTGNTIVRNIQTVEEVSEDASLDLEFPFYFEDDSEERGFKFGVGGRHNDRQRKNRGLIYNLNIERQNDANTSPEGIPADELLANVPGTNLTLGEALLLNPSLISDYFTGVTSTGAFYGDGSVGAGNLLGQILNNVDATHEISGLYLTGDFFFDNWFVRGGLRYESEKREASYVDPRPLVLPAEIDPPPTLEETVFLPAVTFGTKLFDDRLSLIAAWSRTVSRPTFYEWVPTRSLELTSGLVRNGNPLLENSSITNFDLGADLQLNDSSLLRVGVFRKNIQDPIIETRGEVSGEAAINYNNGQEGILQGLELELDIDDIGPFSLTTNVTYIDAELSYLDSVGANVLSERFPYQPRIIMNFNLGYESEEKDFGVNLVYNFTGEYLTTVRTDVTDANLKQNALHTFDLVVRKDFDFFGDSTFSLVGGVKNLFATRKELTFDGGGSDGTVFGRENRDRAYFFEGSVSF